MRLIKDAIRVLFGRDMKLGDSATLSVLLMVNDVVVKKSEDHILWHRVFGDILNGKANPPSDLLAGGRDSAVSRDSNQKAQASPASFENPIDKMAREIGVDPGQLEAACSPATEFPYMRLDERHWEVMRKEVGRGKFAIAPFAAAATLLLLWFKRAEINDVARPATRAVLSPINAPDKNPNRSVKNASWLRMRGSQIVLNSEGFSRAEQLAKCFCTKDWTAWKEGTNS